MKRFKVETPDWFIELNASSIEVAIGYGAKQLVKQQRQETKKPVTSIAIRATFIYNMKHEYFITLQNEAKEWIEQKQLGTFTTYRLACMAADQSDICKTPTGVTKNYYVKDRYVRIEKEQTCAS